MVHPFCGLLPRGSPLWDVLIGSPERGDPLGGTSEAKFFDEIFGKPVVRSVALVRDISRLPPLMQAERARVEAANASSWRLQVVERMCWGWVAFSGSV